MLSIQAGHSCGGERAEDAGSTRSSAGVSLMRRSFSTGVMDTNSVSRLRFTSVKALLAHGGRLHQRVPPGLSSSDDMAAWGCSCSTCCILSRRVGVTRPPPCRLSNANLRLLHFLNNNLYMSIYYSSLQSDDIAMHHSDSVGYELFEKACYSVSTTMV